MARSDDQGKQWQGPEADWPTDAEVLYFQRTFERGKREPCEPRGFSALGFRMNSHQLGVQDKWKRRVRPPISRVFDNSLKDLSTLACVPGDSFLLYAPQERHCYQARLELILPKRVGPFHGLPTYPFPQVISSERHDEAPWRCGQPSLQQRLRCGELAIFVSNFRTQEKSRLSSSREAISKMIAAATRRPVKPPTVKSWTGPR